MGRDRRRKEQAEAEREANAEVDRARGVAMNIVRMQEVFRRLRRECSKMLRIHGAYNDDAKSLLDGLQAEFDAAAQADPRGRGLREYVVYLPDGVATIEADELVCVGDSLTLLAGGEMVAHFREGRWSGWSDRGEVLPAPDYCEGHEEPIYCRICGKQVPPISISHGARKSRADLPQSYAD